VIPPRKSLPPFEALRAFDAVARLGGVRKAAQSLFRDHAVISRHLRTLEAWTGATLIERTAAGIVLTADGARYHKLVAAALDAISSATTDLMRHGQRHRLYIRSIPGFAQHWISRRLGEFEKMNPGLDIELRPTERSAVETHDGDIDIRFVAAYARPPEIQVGLRTLEIARPPIVAVASPGYLASAGKITQPRDLLEHHLLHEENFDRWGSWLVARGVYKDVYLTGPRLWQSNLTLDAARAGRGIALANHLVVWQDLASGRLEEIGKDLETFRPYAVGMYLFIARAERWDEPLIRNFRDWLVSGIARELPALKPPAID